MGIRINQKPPDVVITKSGKGGLALTTSVKLTKLSQATVKWIAEAYGLTNGSILIREDITDDQLIDVLTGNRRYASALVVLNKVDLVNEQYLAVVKRQVGTDFVPISAEKGLNIDLLTERIWETLDFKRDRKSTRLNSSHTVISYAVFCLKKKKKKDSNSVL